MALTENDSHELSVESEGDVLTARCSCGWVRNFRGNPFSPLDSILKAGKAHGDHVAHAVENESEVTK